MQLILKIFISFFLSFGICADEECVIFGCGNIVQTQGSPTKCIDDDIDNHWKSRPCRDPETHCQSVVWTNVGQASVSECVVTKSPVDNSLVPGDFCSEDSFCFGIDGEVSCKDNVCVTNKENGNSCPADTDSNRHRYCPVGSYCKSEACAAQFEEGEICEEGNACKFGLACVATNDDLDDYKCTRLNSIEDQKQFAVDRFVNAGLIWTGHHALCKSYHNIQLDEIETKECRKGDLSIDQESYSTLRPGMDCNYTSFSEDSPIEGIFSQDLSHCGFNKNSNAFCTMRKGDDWFLKRLDKFRETDLATIDCHTNSEVHNCKAFMEMISEDVRIDFNQSTMAVDNMFGYHLVANNDRCIAETVTATFWNGRLPSNATGFQEVIGVLMVILMILC